MADIDSQVAVQYTDKKDNQIMNGAVAKSYMTNGLLIYG